MRIFCFLWLGIAFGAVIEPFKSFESIERKIILKKRMAKSPEDDKAIDVNLVNDSQKTIILIGIDRTILSGSGRGGQKTIRLDSSVYEYVKRWKDVGFKVAFLTSGEESERESIMNVLAEVGISPERDVPIFITNVDMGEWLKRTQSSFFDGFTTIVHIDNNESVLQSVNRTFCSDRTCRLVHLEYPQVDTSHAGQVEASLKDAVLKYHLEHHLPLISDLKRMHQKKVLRQIPDELDLSHTATGAHLLLNHMYDPENAKIGNTLKLIAEKLNSHTNGAVSSNNHIARLFSEPEENLGDLQRRLPFKRAIIDALKAEANDKESFVFYHGTRGSLAFIYKIYTLFRQALNMNIDNQSLNVLRENDLFFRHLSKVDDFIKDHLLKRGKPTDSLAGIQDEQKGFQNYGLSVNPFLFSSFNEQTSCTYLYFYDNHAMSEFDPKFLLVSFLTSLGLTEDAFKKYYTLYLENEALFKKGSLLQFMIHPDIVDDVVYLSRVHGVGIHKDINLSRPREKLNQIKENWTNRDNGLSDLDLNSLQARIFLKPEYMQDPSKVRINFYTQLDDSEKRRYEVFEQKITEFVMEDLKTILKQHLLFEEGAFFDKSEPALQKAYRYALQNRGALIHGEKSKESELSSIIKKTVEKMINDQPVVLDSIKEFLLANPSVDLSAIYQDQMFYRFFVGTDDTWNLAEVLFFIDQNIIAENHYQLIRFVVIDNKTIDALDLRRFIKLKEVRISRAIINTLVIKDIYSLEHIEIGNTLNGRSARLENIEISGLPALKDYMIGGNFKSGHIDLTQSTVLKKHKAKYINFNVNNSVIFTDAP